MRKLYVPFMVSGALLLGIGLVNVSTLVKSVIAGTCQCQEGCPCSHCSGKGRDCNCK
ncbi:MAG: hypothetical protein UZ01_00671 [Candidatus Brocadia sinica]|uniref:hypothetical protein n=1 Tax=Candidatus Brocadia TaxID=380240 RepID=UPI0007953A6E|nr:MULTISPECIES: hypothetical protein [Brocadia]KXK32065.1 MAG: hypothetical protein UZ01_00671 [Candidatus Brocadia sinica]MCK6469431.1 hypothetical protein [Candidatus Brocadia sinica]